MGRHTNYILTKAPPQLWKVEMVRKQMETPDTPPETAARLSLRHTYMPKKLVEFAGPSHFGGKGDQLIVCAGKGRPPTSTETAYRWNLC